MCQLSKFLSKNCVLLWVYVFNFIFHFLCGFYISILFHYFISHFSVHLFVIRQLNFALIYYVFNQFNESLIFIFLQHIYVLVLTVLNIMFSDHQFGHQHCFDSLFFWNKVQQWIRYTQPHRLHHTLKFGAVNWYFSYVLIFGWLLLTQTM